MRKTVSSAAFCALLVTFAILAADGKPLHAECCDLESGIAHCSSPGCTGYVAIILCRQPGYCGQEGEPQAVGCCKSYAITNLPGGDCCIAIPEELQRLGSADEHAFYVRDCRGKYVRVRPAAES